MVVPTVIARTDTDPIAVARTRPPGPGRTVWLASFPKSGNTWMRAIVTGLATHRHLFAVNHLGSGSQPNHVSGSIPALGLDPRWLTRSELAPLRDALVRRYAEGDSDEPILRKTHEVYRPGPAGGEPFPTDATRAAILVVRDPRDVACSYAPFFGVSLDKAIDRMGRSRPGKPQPAFSTTDQPWGSWSSHAQSWLAPEVPFPVHLVRFEDLKKDAVATLSDVFRAIGLSSTDEELTHAVEMARFERLRESEAQSGFVETSRATEEFFRRGVAGGWREELDDAQIAAVEADHRDVMGLLGYDLTHDQRHLDTVYEVRQSRRRQEKNDWMHLPEHLGISVSEGSVPDELPGARRPRPWIQVSDDAVLLHFASGPALLVRDGNEAIIQWDPEKRGADEDPSWLVQGWAVTLSMLQRGRLSLHAATLRVGDQTVALAGNRGAGKSTTSMTLRARGHQLLIDDVTLIEFQDDRAWALPYSRNVHLLPDAAASLGLDFDAMRPLAGGRNKAAFRTEPPPEDPEAIDQIVVLRRNPNATEVELTHMRGADRVLALTNQTSRDGIAPLVLGSQKYFELLTRLADSAPVSVITRPTNAWSMDDVVARIEDLCSRDGR